MNGLMMVKEAQIRLKTLLRGFWDDILRRTILFFFVGSLIIIVFPVLRYNPLSYIILFVVCFGINFFYCIMKREIKKEFYGDY
jgi:hypothetical protein